jgi:hypothetical protein
MRFPHVTQDRLSKTQNVITSSNDLTPEWLTSVLHRNGIAEDTAVSGVRVILSKDLQVSRVHRLAVEYRGKASETDRPQTLFLKLCKALSREPRGVVQAEIEFYQTAAKSMSHPPLVRCYDAAYSDATGRSHLLLEDLTRTHSQPTQTRAPSDEFSRQAVEALAKAHRAWWESAKLGNGVGKIFDDNWLREFVENLEKSVAEFSEAARLTADQKGAYRLMMGNANRIWGRLTDRTNLTVTHGDLHWWNFLYPRDTHTHDVRLFDWQLWHIDLGARDLAFLLALGGFAEPRPELEKELLRVYHNSLDIENYSWEALQEDYRWSAIRNLNIPIIFWSQGKHYSTWQTALRRAFDSFGRLNCDELF